MKLQRLEVTGGSELSWTIPLKEGVAARANQSKVRWPECAVTVQISLVRSVTQAGLRRGSQWGR